MNLPFLDAGGAGLVFIAFGIFVLFIGLAIIIETLIMILMKYNTRFKKAFLDSLLLNMASLAVGFVLWQFFRDFLRYYSLLSLVILYAVTVMVESGLLYLLNRKHPVGKTLGVCLVMNLVTYILLFFISRI